MKITVHTPIHDSSEPGQRNRITAAICTRVELSPDVTQEKYLLSHC
jgi:hypothetical protein